MATNPATSADLQSRSFRQLSSDELTVGETLLADAWAIMVTARPSVAERLDRQPPNLAFKAVVVQILCAMVLRVISNPEGKLEERLDDHQYRRDSSVSTGELYISDAELARLSEDDDSDGAWTIGPNVSHLRKCWTGPDSWEPA